MYLSCFLSVLPLLLVLLVKKKKINFKDLKIIGVWGGAQQNKKKTET